MQNKEQVIFINNDYSNEIDLINSEQLFFIIVPETDIKVNIKLLVKKEINKKVSVYIISNKDIDFYLETDSKISNSKLDIEVFSLANDNSMQNITLNSIVKQNILETKINQKIKGLLLSDRSKILGNPKLKIDSMDTLATHSLSIGGINLEEEFYLRSKGFSAFETKKIIINSYLNNAYDLLNNDETIVNKINQIIKES